MDDTKVLGRINDPAYQEHELFERESHGKASDADRARLREIVHPRSVLGLAASASGLTGRRARCRRRPGPRREDGRRLHGVSRQRQSCAFEICGKHSLALGSH
jgi:hypothetical protein